MGKKKKEIQFGHNKELLTLLVNSIFALSTSSSRADTLPITVANIINPKSMTMYKNIAWRFVSGISPSDNPAMRPNDQ